MDTPIDSRFDKLLERHEALTQSVELIMIAQRETSERHNAALDKIITATKTNTENIAGLAGIAEGHEHRIERLEGGKG